MSNLEIICGRQSIEIYAFMRANPMNLERIEMLIIFLLVFDGCYGEVPLSKLSLSQYFPYLSKQGEIKSF